MFARFLGSRRLFDRPDASDVAAPAGSTLYVIGDVHGRADLLEPLLEQIAQDADGRESGETSELIFLGNLIDGGPDSRLVVDLVLMTQFDPRFSRTVALRGTHEAAMRRFLDDARNWPDWAVRGARATLLAYGAPAPPPFAERARWEDARQRFAAAMPPDHASFFAGMKSGLTRGDYRFVRSGAGAVAGRAPTGVVVCGGSRGERRADPRRIRLDTEPHATGELLALKLVGPQRSWLRVTAGRRSSPLVRKRS